MVISWMTAVFAQIDMHRLQTVDALLRGVRQIVVGVAHVDILRVATTAGQRDSELRRRFRWHGIVRLIGAPLLPRDAGSAPSQYEFLHLSRRRLWKLVNEADPLRRLEMRQIAANVKLEFVLGRSGTFP